MRPDEIDTKHGVAVRHASDERMSGYAAAAMERGEEGYFSVPLVSHIAGNLWMGGCLGGLRLPDDFETVVPLYPWERYELGPKTVRHEFEMRDSTAGVPPKDQLYLAAGLVNRSRAQGKTLVHCQAGLNRSGLVTALALTSEYPEGSTTAREAIAMLRLHRDEMVLCNKTFEGWLLALDEERS